MMNDYLWDKTGEPEEDVRRLEELLGTLRHSPAPLRLPAAPPAPQVTRRPFRPAYAAAAALALAAMAGLWLAFTSARDARTPHAAATNHVETEKTRRTESPAPVASSEQLASSVPRQETPGAVTAAGGESDKGADAPAASPRVNQRRLARASSERVNRSASHRATAAKRREESSAAALASAATPPAPTREQQAAKEQLMFALRLTSAKLGDVNRKASGVPAAPRPSAFEQNKLR